MIAGSTGRRELFMDTSAWAAVQVERDPYHRPAIEVWQRIIPEPISLATTNLVVGETYTFIRTRYGYAAAWGFVDWVRDSPRVRLSLITPEIEADAYSILRQYRDQDFSFVDATSFAFMRHAGITEAFAFDHHFSAAGFIRIPPDPAVR